MIKLYITISIIATILSFIADIRAKTNKNINKYLKIHSKNKTLAKRLISCIKDIFICWVPIMNLLMLGMALYIIVTSELNVIKLLDKAFNKSKQEEKELEQYLNDL